MLGLLSKNAQDNQILANTNSNSNLAIRDIINDLINARNIAKKIGETEIQYLTSIALESAREKMYLQIYENK
jgi:hypothetical protein